MKKDTASGALILSVVTDDLGSHQFVVSFVDDNAAHVPAACWAKDVGWNSRAAFWADSEILGFQSIVCATLAGS